MKTVGEVPIDTVNYDDDIRFDRIHNASFMLGALSSIGVSRPHPRERVHANLFWSKFFSPDKKWGNKKWVPIQEKHSQ